MTAEKTAGKKKTKKKSQRAPQYPRHSIEKALRIPTAILEQNAGKQCTAEESAKYVGVKFNKGPYAQEITSSVRYGLLERPGTGIIKLSDLAKRILKPQKSGDKEESLQIAVLNAPVISDIYTHYRGENLPDEEFFNNALMDKFKIPETKLTEFKSIFFESLKFAHLIEEHDGKYRIIDVSSEPTKKLDTGKVLEKLEKGTKIKATDSCFVMMPFADPLGSYYEKIYKPAIEKAGLTPLRADNEIFGTGKIMDQIWSGIHNSRILIAELTSRNPNVFYELGLAHALQKPVVLVSSNEQDVPFDLHHIRVIYYDVNDPFWGNKLIEKVAENILSALKNPEEAILKKFD